VAQAVAQAVAQIQTLANRMFVPLSPSLSMSLSICFFQALTKHIISVSVTVYSTSYFSLYL